MVFKEVILVEMLHARPATYFVKEASFFMSDIFVECNGKKSDAKSILGVLALGGNPGDALGITASGPDEELAIEKLVGFVEAGCDKAVS